MATLLDACKIKETIKAAKSDRASAARKASDWLIRTNSSRERTQGSYTRLKNITLVMQICGAAHVKRLTWIRDPVVLVS